MGEEDVVGFTPDATGRPWGGRRTDGAVLLELVKTAMQEHHGYRIAWSAIARQIGVTPALVTMVRMGKSGLGEAPRARLRELILSGKPLPPYGRLANGLEKYDAHQTAKHIPLVEDFVRVDNICRRSSDRVERIYFIESGAGGPIKIGRAANPKDRCNSLQTGNPEELRILLEANGTIGTEARLHDAFEGLRIRGEWFRRTSDLLETIERFRSGKL